MFIIGCLVGLIFSCLVGLVLLGFSLSSYLNAFASMGELCKDIYCAKHSTFTVLHINKSTTVSGLLIILAK